MPLVGPILGGLIATEFSNKGFTGAQSATLAFAIGNGIVNNILATNFYNGTAIGIGTGVGVGTGFINGIVGSVTGGLIFTAMGNNNIKGTRAIDTAMAIGSAFATHIAAGVVTSSSSPVANGTGTGSLSGIVGTLVGTSILAMMTSSNLKGAQAANLAMAIGEGIANSIALGIITTTIVGAGYPPTPVTGIDVGKMF